MKILKHIKFIAIIFIFLSCATLTSKKNYEIKITSNVKNSKVKVNDSLIYNLPANITVKRSKDSLNLTLLTDIKKDFIAVPSISRRFLYGNMLFIYFSPVAYLVDLTNKKRFTYGYRINLISNDINIIRAPISASIHKYFLKKHKINIKRGKINYKISFPWINNFVMKPQKENLKNNTGFLGISTGIEYFYKTNRYFSVDATFVMDFFIPIPAAVRYEGEVEFMNSSYVSISNNYVKNRLNFGYGISFASNTWDLKNYVSFYDEPPTREPEKKIHNTFGLVFSMYHRFNKKIRFAQHYIGIIYRPTFITVTPYTYFNYEHIISIEYIWKFRIKK